jgi:hypothetical protein
MRIGGKLYHIRFEIMLFVAQASAAADACATSPSPLEMHSAMNDNKTAPGSLASN